MKHERSLFTDLFNYFNFAIVIPKLLD